MKRFLPVVFFTLLLSACASGSPSTDHGGHETGTPQPRSLSLFDETGSGDIAFSVYLNDEIFTEYGLSHTKTMHLILVRDDLRHFAHLHPEMDDNGAWRVTYAPPAGGSYWAYADFVEENGAPHTIRFEQAHKGIIGERGLVKNDLRERIVDGYRVTLETKEEGDVGTFTYRVTDGVGQPAKLEPYLGALGHSVLINPAGGFIHTHPAENAKELIFTVKGPLQSDFYRAFTQFQIGGKVHTVDFDWQL